MAVPPEPPSSKGHRTRNRVVVVVVVVAATMVALFTVPVTSSFSAKFGPYGAPLPPGLPIPSAGLDPPTGSHVWGTFSVNGTEAMPFQVSDGNDNVVYTDNATQGSFSFTASNPPYTFCAGPTPPESVLVSGHYSSPVLFF